MIKHTFFLALFLVNLAPVQAQQVKLKKPLTTKDLAYLQKQALEDFDLVSTLKKIQPLVMKMDKLIFPKQE